MHCHVLSFSCSCSSNDNAFWLNLNHHLAPDGLRLKLSGSQRETMLISWFWWIETWALIRWAGWMGRAAPDCSLEACSDGHTWQGVRGHAVTNPTRGKTVLKRYHFFLGGGSISLVEVSRTTPLAIWTADGAVQECFCPWKWPPIVWMATSGSEPLWEWSLCLPPSILLGVVLFGPLLERSSTAFWPGPWTFICLVM